MPFKHGQVWGIHHLSKKPVSVSKQAFKNLPKPWDL